MEAVPRLPMVCFELRSPAENTTFGPKLKEYIRNFYNEDPETYSSEIHQLESLRAAAVRPGRDVSAVATMKRYYCQLHFLMSRFPMVKDGSAAVQFSWRDNYMGMTFAVADIRFEISTILYNIGALHTQLGMSDTRTTEDGMKMACTHFQCAAWAFQHLKDTYPPSTEADLVPEIMQFAYHLSLAQAQECILEKSMMDNRKASIIMKVAVQVVNYYSQAFNALKQSVSEEAVGTRVYMGWRRLAKFKETYYRCVIQLFQGMQAEELQKMGERVAFYQLAHDTLEEAVKLSKALDKAEMDPKQVQESLSFTMDVVEGKRKAAKNENEFIYHEEVPDRDQLSKAMGVSLVKGIPFNIDDPEVSGPDIFGRLVPMKAHEASSLYSEEKAKLLRKVGGMIEEKDQSLVSFLSSLQLEYLHCYSQPDCLPQELVDRCAALSAKPNAIQSLIDSMAKLSDTCVEVENMLQEINELLEEEASREKDYQAVMGKRPPSIVATDLTREATKYQEAHAKAIESNQALHKVMTTHVSNLRILSLPLSQLHQQIPPPPSLSDPKSEEIVNEMQSLMEKVEEMRKQRSMLTSQLRESICKDDITQLLITHQHENVEALFEQELKKHDDIVKLIQQNLAAQDNILKAVTDSYARYSTVRKATAEAVKKRQSVINALISCFDAYEDLLAKSEKGHDFYNKLETNVSKLLVRVKSTCKVQQEEREQMLVKNNTSAPKKILNQDADATNNMFSKTVTTPKLKDYLKKDGGSNSNLTIGGYSEVSSLPYSPSIGVYGQRPSPIAPLPGSNYYDSATNITANMANLSVENTSQSWIPSVRPAPLGSEATSILKSEPIDRKELTYSSPTPPATGNYNPGNGIAQYPQQAYNYAGAWGYGSQASTLSSYLPPNVHYPSDSKIGSTGSSSSLQMNPSIMLDSEQSNRIAPAGAVGYNTGHTLSTIDPSQAPSQASLASGHQSDNIVSSYDLGKGLPSHQISCHQNQQSTQSVSGNESGYHYPYSSLLQQPLSTVSSYQNCQPMAMPLNYSEQFTNLTASYHTVPSASQLPDSGSIGQGYHVPSCVQNSFVPTYATQHPSSAANQQALPGYGSSVNYNNCYTSTNTTVPSATPFYTPASNPSDQQYPVGSWPAPQPFGVAQNPSPSVSLYQVSSSLDTSNFQYMDSQNASYYSSAGNYSTVQTSSSYSSTAPSYALNVDSMSPANNYYQAPHYGSQFTNCGPATNLVASIASHENSQQPYPQGMYMQARMPNSDPSTTNSPQTFRSSHAEEGNSSNIDLLAGLDFSISQQPLVPQPGTINNEAPSSLDVEPKEKKKPANGITKNDLSSAEVKSEDRIDVSLNNVNNDAIHTLHAPLGENNLVKSHTLKSPAKDPFQDSESLTQFTQEVEKYEKFVEGLTSKTLNGPTTLDMKWKELTEIQERDSLKRSISVARCYPMKNRFPDILPYDCSRVELPSTKDDYINASFLKDLTPFTPPFILTQAPLPSTYTDFWIMVYEQQVEVIVCLLSDMELNGQIYWPNDKSQEMSVGRMRLNLQTSNARQHWIERILSVSDAETRISRVVIHLQFTSWPGSSFPASPGPFLAFLTECLNFHYQQRVAAHPVVVHCSSGVGRSGLFCLLAAALCELQAGHGLTDLVKLAAAMSERRKGALRDREHLKFAYQSLLYHAQDLLMKRGILTCGSTFEDKRSLSGGKCHTRHPSQDFLLGPPTGLSQLQSGIEKMGLDVGSNCDTAAHDPGSDLCPGYSQSNVEKSASALITSATSSPESSSLRSSPLNSFAPHLTDLSRLTVGMADKDVKHGQKGKTRITSESFKCTGSLIGNTETSDDPFSGIDPLWPLKRS